jgi:hypothetical protein
MVGRRAGQNCSLMLMLRFQSPEDPLSLRNSEVSSDVPTWLLQGAYGGEGRSVDKNQPLPFNLDCRSCSESCLIQKARDIKIGEIVGERSQQHDSQQPGAQTVQCPQADRWKNSVVIHTLEHHSARNRTRL